MGTFLGQFKLLLLIVLLHLPFISLGQFEYDYQRQKPSGKIPAYLSIPFLENYNPFDTRTEQAAPPTTEDDFWQESNYYLNQLLLSGKILYNDPISNYISEVADHLLRNHPLLRRKLRFFAVKSPSLNAFSSNQGVVLINVGLIARLDNEAQLAFILAHEISHIVNKHQRDFYIANREWEEQIRETNDKRYMRRMLMEQRKYSQETELEADRKGLDLFLSSKYDLNAIPSCFDIIRTKEIAFENKAFHPNFFAIPNIQYPDSFFLDSYAPADEKALIYRQYSSTHPAAEVRRNEIIDTIRNMANDFEGRNLYMSGPQRFHQIREICRFETCFSYLAYADYEKSFYWSYLMLQKFPENRFLKKCLGQALYRLALYKQKGKFWDIHTNYEQVSDSSQSLFYFFEQIDPEALITLALVYNWRLYVEYPRDEMLDLIIQEIMHELGFQYIDQWSNTDSEFIIQDAEAFHKYALEEPLKHDEFVNKFSRQMGIIAQSNEDSVSTQSNRQSVTVSLEKGLNLGLDNVIIIDPTYYVVDDRLSRREQLEQAGRKRHQLIRMIKEHAASLRLNFHILSPAYMPEDDTTSFQDLYLLNEWFNERNNDQELDAISIYYDELQLIKEKYKTSNFAWIEAGNIAHARSNKGLVLSAGILLPVLLPYSIIYTQTPKHFTFLYGVVYDLKSGIELAKYPKKIMMKDREDVLNSITYDFIFQLKQKGDQ